MTGVSYVRKVFNYYGQPDHPHEVVALVASNVLLQALRAFESTRAWHAGVTGRTLLVVIVAPKFAVANLG